MDAEDHQAQPPETAEHTSKVFFPLRTSVELFADPGSPSAEARAKAAALVFDELIFEPGMLDVTITPSGAMSFWQPPAALTQERRDRARTPIEVGTPVTFSVGVQPGRGEAPKEMRALISDEVSASYVAEWHTNILDDLEPLGVETWVFVTDTGGAAPRGPVADEIAEANRADSRDQELLADRGFWQRKFIIESFNRDCLVGGGLGAVLGVTSLFEPMMRRRDLVPVAAGTNAMSIAVPNLSALPWEEVIAFRNHPGSVEARRLLRTFEQDALDGFADDALSYLVSISQAVAGAFADALSDHRPRAMRGLVKEGGKTLVSFAPVVGPFVEKGITAAELARAAHKFNRSGLAALMSIRNAEA